MHASGAREFVATHGSCVPPGRVRDGIDSRPRTCAGEQGKEAGAGADGCPPALGQWLSGGDREKPPNDQAERPRTLGPARPTPQDGPGARVRTGTREAGFSVRLERLVSRQVTSSKPPLTLRVGLLCSSSSGGVSGGAPDGVGRGVSRRPRRTRRRGKHLTEGARRELD